MTFRAGLAREDITVFEPGMTLLGWGIRHNRAESVAAPLHARALVLTRGEADALALVNLDLCLVSSAVRLAVLERLEVPGLGPHNVLLAATHTHSGPGGYSHHVLYRSTSYGFSPTVFDGIVDGIVTAIRTAHERREPARLRIGTATVPMAAPVAFNRSPEAHRGNADIELDGTSFRPEHATRRESVTLRVEDFRGRPLGAVNWFAVHGTSVHADRTAVHSDNKGMAAEAFEAAMRAEGHDRFVAPFCQEAAGDVSPNFRHSPERGVMIGTHDDDLRSARYHGAVQARWARAGFDAAANAPLLDGPVGGRVRHVAMSDVVVPPDLTHGFGEQRTTKGLLGLPVAAGTAEGPGPLRSVLPLLDSVARRRRAAGLDPKIPWLEVEDGAAGRFLGLAETKKLLGTIGRLEPFIAYLAAAEEAGALPAGPWIPVRLPVQLSWIGSLTIAALPCEPTTQAGRRVRATLQAEGAGRVVVAGYANAYSGYVTTYEEYAAQRYEGAYTAFGPHTLGAYRALMTELYREGIADPRDPIAGPDLYTADETELRRERVVGRTAVSPALLG